MHDLEGGASTHCEDVLIEWQQAIEQTVAQDFIDGVVPADIFANYDRLAEQAENSRRVQSPRAFKSGLLAAEFCRNFEQHLR